METLKKILFQIKDLVIGLAFTALMIGFMLLVAAALYYFKPQDLFTDHAAYPRNPLQQDYSLAARLALYGLTCVGASALTLILARLGALAWRRRQAKAAKPEPAGESNA